MVVYRLTSTSKIDDSGFKVKVKFCSKDVKQGLIMKTFKESNGRCENTLKLMRVKSTWVFMSAPPDHTTSFPFEVLYLFEVNLKQLNFTTK